jgi:hypothetical protein
VSLVDAVDPATTRISTGERLEMEPRFGTRMTDRLQAAPALGTGDRSRPTVAHGEDRSKV